jgi:hypothetical protein
MASAETAPPISDETIADVIVQILQDSDLENTTEFKVRKLASEKLNTDLNSSAHKKLVRKVVEDYLSSKASAAAEGVEEVVEAEGDQKEVGSSGEGQNDGRSVEDGSDEEDGEKHPKGRVAPAAEQKKKPSFGGDNEDQLVCQVSLSYKTFHFSFHSGFCYI